jgi:maleylacetoacetate isomerase
VELAAFPTLLRIERNCLALPAFDLARPERQPDAAAR